MLAIGLVAVALGLGWFLVITVGLAWATVALFTRTASSTSTHPDARTLAAKLPASARAEIRSASSEQLCTLWLQTGQEMKQLCTLWLQTGQEMKQTYLPSTLCSYADLRHAILDELTARDPDGVSRWLGDQPDRRDLRAYLHDRQA